MSSLLLSSFVMSACLSVMAQLNQEPTNAVKCPSFKSEKIGASIGLCIPEPIGESDISNYRFILHLSDAQANALSQKYALYCSQCVELKHAKVEKIHARAVQYTRNGNSDPQELAAVLDDRDEIVKVLSANDENLMTSLAALLSESQQPMMAIVRADRSRQVCGEIAFDTALYPEARIDLIDLLTELHVAESESVELHQVLSRYRVDVGNVICAIARQWSDGLKKDSSLFAELRAIEGPQRAQIATEVIEARKALLKPRIRQDRLLKEINLRYVAELLKVLPPEQARKFEAEFKFRSYPHVYSDREGPSTVIERVLALDDLTDDQRTAIQIAADQYVASYDRASKEMEKLETEWFETILGGGQTTEDEREGHKYDLAMATAKRWSFAKIFTDQIASVLTPEQAAKLGLKSPRAQNAK